MRASEVHLAYMPMLPGLVWPRKGAPFPVHTQTRFRSEGLCLQILLGAEFLSSLGETVTQEKGTNRELGITEDSMLRHNCVAPVTIHRRQDASTLGRQCTGRLRLAATTGLTVQPVPSAAHSNHVDWLFLLPSAEDEEMEAHRG